MRIARATLASFLIFSAGVAWAQVEPASLPARDAHEGLIVAADPYHDAARAKLRLGKKNPHEGGILAIELFFRNDNNNAVRVNLDRIRLLLAPPGGERQRLEPLALDEVIDRILNKDKKVPGLDAPRPRWPRTKPQVGRGKDWQELEERLGPLRLEMDVIPPRATVRGFLFFDLNYHFDWVRYARLYMPELKFTHNDQPLFFFEVDLSRAVAP